MDRPDDLKECAVCGHLKGDHHISWLPNGYELVEECEYDDTCECRGYRRPVAESQ